MFEFGRYRYPQDRVHPHTSSKSKKEQNVHSRAVTYTVASDHTSLQRWASALPRVPQPQISPPCWGELRRCHVFRGPGSRLLVEVSSGAATCPSAPDLASLIRWAPTLSRVPQFQALPPREESSGVATYPTAPSGLWTTGIKKCLTAPGTRLGSHIYKVHSCVSEVPVRRADMPL
jgi:hypothetical protein